MRDDLRSALRSLRARPGASAVAVACLALGIGVNVALFGVLDALWLSPPAGVADAEGLVRVRVGSEQGPLARGAGPTASYEQFRIVSAERADVLAGLAAYGRRSATLGGGAGARPLDVLVVTASYFSTLGVRPALGRFFDRREGAAGAGVPVVVLSHRYWRDAYGSDPDALGRSMSVNGVSLPIVGVAPEGFVGVDLGDPDAWIPMGLVGLPEFGGERAYGRGAYWLQFVGRLRPGVDLDAAVARTAPPPAPDPWVAQPYVEPTSAGQAASLPVTLLPLRTMFFEDQRGRGPVPLWAMGVSAAVLLLACGTVANILLAQAVRRRREVAIRLAMGGSPGRIVRARLTEGLLLAIAAAVAATTLAAASPSVVRTLPIPPLQQVVSPRAALLGLAVAVLSPLLFGALPALWAARREIGEAIREGGAETASASRLQRGFMAAQTAIGFVLLVAAGLFVGSLRNARLIDTGMELDRMLVVYADFTSGTTGASGMEAVAGSTERLRALPGVEAAALGWTIPFYLFTRGGFRVPDGRPDDEQPRSVLVNAVGAGFFEGLGIDVVAGRAFDGSDREGSQPVAIVSEPLARDLWGRTSPVGMCIDVSGEPGAACAEVVGVAGGVRYEGLLDEPSRVLYLPIGQVPGGLERSVLFLRTAGDPGRLVPSVRAAVQSLDASLPYLRIEPLAERVRPQLLRWEVGTRIFTALGGLAVLLAAVGLYTVASFESARRTKELGVRAALGARRHRLLLLVLLDGLRVSSAGLAVGALLAALVAGLLRSHLQGVSPADGRVYLAVAAAMTLVAAAASLVPAARASTADPAAALRSE